MSQNAPTSAVLPASPERTPTLRSTPSARHRFHLLDALRGLVAVLVVFWHAPAFAKLPVERNGFLAVDFFFCLSGFVVAFSYESRLETGLSFSGFARTRLIRLYPVYLAALVAGLCIAIAFSLRFHTLGLVRGCLLPFFFFELFMLPAAVTAGNPWLFPLDFPAWSIFFELVANFAYAALVRAGWARTRHLAALFFVTALSLTLWVSRGENLDQGATHTFGSIAIGLLRVLVSFIAGVLALRLLRRGTLAPWKAGKGTAVALLLTTALVLLLLDPSPLPGSALSKVLTLAILFPGIVYLGALCRLPSVLTSACSWLGDLSYPVYLFHLHFLRILALPFIARIGALHPALRPLWVPSVLLLCTAACVALLRFFDEPARAFLQHRHKQSMLHATQPARLA